MGIGISVLYTTFFQRFRFFERTYLTWLSLWDRREGQEDLVIKPTNPLLTTEYAKNDADGSIRLLVTPDKAASFRLHVSVISIHPGREIPSQRAASVEFYYCLSGKGAFSQQGLHERAEIRQGDSFTVNAGSIRWISNSVSGNTKEDLVLLRACDGGSWYSHPDFDVIRVDPNGKFASTNGGTVAAMTGYVSEGMRKVQNIAREYAGQKSNE